MSSAERGSTGTAGQTAGGSTVRFASDAHESIEERKADGDDSTPTAVVAIDSAAPDAPSTTAGGSQESAGSASKSTSMTAPATPGVPASTTSKPILALMEKTRIVAVTAMSSEAHRRRGLVECGIDVWMAKPVGIKVLREEIDRVKKDMEDRAARA